MTYTQNPATAAAASPENAPEGARRVSLGDSPSSRTSDSPPTERNSRRLSKSTLDRIKAANHMIRAGNLDAALDEFEDVVKTDPDSEAVHFGLANIHFKQRRYDQALHHLAEVRKLNPKMAQAPLCIGRVYMRQSRLVEAMTEFRKALAIDPRMSMVYISIAQTLAQEKRFAEAESLFRKGLKYDPRSTPARAALSQVYADQGKFDQALEELNMALAYYPADELKSLLYLRIGRVYAGKTEHDAAVEAFQTALSHNNELPPARMGLVESLIQLDRLDEAVAQLREIPRAPQIEPLKYRLWGDIYKRQGLNAQAEEAYRAAALMITETDQDLATRELEELDLLLGTPV